ncbi:hypothetical protein [Streptomyces longisporoflavus]|uniref:Resolvase/invertase-type recombinase catalytic domain-containing protein n=1 Tax=Streptomyces longisporoflavus TaxID=28044 RepID=A0ABW7R349_9ACTN
MSIGYARTSTVRQERASQLEAPARAEVTDLRGADQHPREGPPRTGKTLDGERVLQLAANWREAALELREFAPQRPVLRLVSDTTPPVR